MEGELINLHTSCAIASEIIIKLRYIKGKDVIWHESRLLIVFEIQQ